MAKISFNTYRELLMDPDSTEADILQYSKIAKGNNAFDWTLIANEDLVDITDEDRELENALSIGNGIARWKRRNNFKRKRAAGSDLPVLVSEGDSWFQFPFLIKDTIDHLSDDFLIWSVGAAGDTAENMLMNSNKIEYLSALRKYKSDVKAFLLSAAGNDIIGEDPLTGIPVLQSILNTFNGDNNDIPGHINFSVLADKLNFLRKAYTQTINTIRNEPGFETLPIIIHGYDYVFPYPWKEDNRNPSHASNNEWLGQPLDVREIMDTDLRRNILIKLIDELYALLADIAGDSTSTGVWLVDCRNTLSEVTDWADEIHGTSDGFAKVAEKFKAVLDKAIS